MSETFKHHDLDAMQKSHSNVIRQQAEMLETAIKAFCPVSRETSLAMTNLEQAVMWANKSIALHGAKED